jgi:sRNA-binding regulator protein Hfq
VGVRRGKMISKNVLEAARGARVIITLQNGKELRGKIIECTNQEIFFRSADGSDIVVSIDSIACITIAEKVKNFFVK